MRGLDSLSEQSSTSGRLVRQIVLLLTLAAGLTGFLVLLNLLLPLASPTPEGLWASRAPTDDSTGFPSGVGLLTVSVLAVSVILGISALLLTQRGPLSLDRLRLSRPLVAGVLAFLFLVGLGGYLALSGALGQDLSNERGLVESSLLRPSVLAALSGFLLLIILVGILNPRLLLPALMVALTAAVVMWAVREWGGTGSELTQPSGSGGIPSPPEPTPIDPRALIVLLGLIAIAVPILIARLLAWRPAGDARGSGVGRFLLNLLILLILAALILWLLSPRESGGQAVSGGGGVGEFPGNLDGGGAELGDGLPGVPSFGAEALEQLLKLLEQDGADVSRLENGSAVVQLDGEVSLLTGTSTGQAAEHDPVPLFEVSGAANTGYLRTGVGDVYDGANWAQLDPVSVSYDGAGNVADSVAEVYASPTGGLAGLPEWRRESALLTGLPGRTSGATADSIQVTTTGSSGELSSGTVPVSMPLSSAGVRGQFHPFSGTFSVDEPVEYYSWTSTIPSYSPEEYAAAVTSSDPTYTQLPDDLPDRIRSLALDVTASHPTPYAKAKALEHYLRTQYAYRYASTADEGLPPPGRDPVDWFLFDRREGTCGAFSTAFAVMARSIGIPARVVTGWVVAPTADPQVVESRQAHQWVEVPFEGIGWVRFEPTASGGAPSRLAEAFPGIEQIAPTDAEPPASESATGGTGDQIAAPDLDGPNTAYPVDPQATPVVEARLETVTTITQWPSQIHRQAPFSVGGTVTTAAGDLVSDAEVEIYVNETKEHGGTIIGGAEVSDGKFEAGVVIPFEIELGNYQLLARTVQNNRINESWSDPDITVVSRSGLELTGPSEVAVDVDAAFRGRLSDDSGGGQAGRVIAVVIDGSPGLTVTTGPEGGFSFTRSFAETGPHWVEVTIQGDDLLMGNSARLDFFVTLPTETEITVPVIVEVGRDFTVTGKLLDARGEPVGDVSLNARIAGQEQTVFTDDSGEFGLTGNVNEAGRYGVEVEFAGRPPALPSSAVAHLVTRHALILTLDVPDRFQTGIETAITGSVSSPTLPSIGRLPFTLEDAEGSRLAAVTTDDDGNFELTYVPSENVLAEPLAIRYAGDDLLMPVSYSLNVSQGEAPGTNWLPWVGVPAAAAAAVAVIFLGRRVLARRLSSLDQREPATEIAEPVETIELQSTSEPDVGLIEVRFVNNAEDLPDVWGVGETVEVEVVLAGSDGESISSATVEVTIANAEVSSELTTDESGRCSLSWAAGPVGEYVVRAAVAGDGRDLVASGSRSLRVVDFREEIVRLYDVFLDWARGRSSGIQDQFTPREVEMTLVSQGLAVDQKALDGVISQYEEADYSEHPITRRHYEAMYRAWHKVVEEARR